MPRVAMVCCKYAGVSTEIPVSVTALNVRIMYRPVQAVETKFFFFSAMPW